MTIRKTAEIVNFDEAMKVVDSIKDPATNQLVNSAVFTLLKKFSGEQAHNLSIDFDLKLFVDVLTEFCSDHNFITRVLAGEDLRLLDSIDTTAKEESKVQK